MCNACKCYSGHLQQLAKLSASKATRILQKIVVWQALQALKPLLPQEFLQSSTSLSAATTPYARAGM